MMQGQKAPKSADDAKASEKKTSEIGTILANRYEVIQELGRGGMGVVYLCKDSVSRERVALKRLRPPEEAKAARADECWWFHQEARAVASLEHPALVRARDFGILHDGSPYLVMDVLPGRSVHEWMHTTTMPWPVIWALVDQVLAGLAHAHARHVIHGDLKPSNVMLDLASTGKGPRAYVLDLGLAWLRESRHDSRLHGTPEPELAVHAGAGTVGWVAPEQIRKQATLVGPATDLYALGCIVYRVLTGKEVFEGTTQEVLRAHKRVPVARPLLPEGVPSQVAIFIQRLLAKKPWHRFELAADARRVWAQFRPRHSPTLEETVASTPAAPPEPSSTPDVGRALAAAKSLAPGLLSLRPSPMVARDRERQELMDLALSVCAGHSPKQRMVLLVGEAGVGKSRLAEWMCEQVHERGLMWPLRARYGRTPSPLDGLTGAVNSFYGLQGADRDTVEQTLLDRWGIDRVAGDELAWVSATAEWLRPTPPGAALPPGPTGKHFVLDTPELRFSVARRVLERIGTDRPILIWLDDLHLTSANTFETLSRIKRDSPRLRLIIVATARSEALETDLDAAARMEALRAEWNGKVVDLRPFGVEETEVLLRATLPLRESAVRAAVARSRGNPLFALQLLHAWAGGGYFTLEGGKYTVPEDALHGRAITTADLWDERLRAVPVHLHLAAYAAAAIGDDVRSPVLTALLTALEIDPREALVVLTRAQILLASGNDQFRWPHALLLEHLLGRLHEQSNAPTIFRLASDALAHHPEVGSRRIMKHRVRNLLRAGDNDAAARVMFDFIEGAWARGRDTAATFKDLTLLEGRVSGATAAEYAYWRAEALRHIGKLEEARAFGESSQRAFQQAGDRTREAHALLLLGHLSSDLGAPAEGREQVILAATRFKELEDERGLSAALVVLGEIDYLLGEHTRARAVLHEASMLTATVGDVLGRAQCFVLLAMIETAAGRYRSACKLANFAHQSFDAIGYRLGMAQCDVVLGHAAHRAAEMDTARSRALSARAAFRELTNPRGEAACERLLALVAIDTGDLPAGGAHASVAAKIFERLQDPWGDLEAKLLLVQVALAKGDPQAKQLALDCEKIVVDEAEPRQHRHLTLAWLAQTEERWRDAAIEIDLARSAFGDTARCGDHTPQLLKRFARMEWLGPASGKVSEWLDLVENVNPDEPVSSRWRASRRAQ
ncbi:MAG: protein kinase [Polyangiaceae bacterium]|nr:protein kinase [Polyangiaceae bacterium]